MTAVSQLKQTSHSFQRPVPSRIRPNEGQLDMEICLTEPKIYIILDMYIIAFGYDTVKDKI